MTSLTQSGWEQEGVQGSSDQGQEIPALFLVIYMGVGSYISPIYIISVIKKLKYIYMQNM
jgi:hypothetical protein